MKKNIVLIIGILVCAAVYLMLRPEQTERYEVSSGTGLTAEEKVARQSFWRYFREATNYRIAGEIEKATLAYQEALLLNPRHEDTLYYLGNLLYQQQAYDDAHTMWQQLVQVNPTSTRAYLQLGDFYLNQKLDSFNVELAEKAYRTALSINKEETKPTLRLGQIALLKNDLTKAVECFELVVASNYRSVTAYAMLGYIHWINNEHEKASQNYQKAFEMTAPMQSVDNIPGEGDTRNRLQQTDILDVFDIEFDGYRTSRGMQSMHAAYEALQRRIEEMIKLTAAE